MLDQGSPPELPELSPEVFAHLRTAVEEQALTNLAMPAATPENIAETGKLRFRYIFFADSISRGFNVLESATKKGADDLEKRGGVFSALSYAPRGLYYLFKGFRYASTQIADIVLSPNAIMLWTLASSVAMLYAFWGPTTGLILLGVTAATVVGNAFFKGYQLYNMEKARREHKALVKLTEMEHDLERRIDILLKAGIDVPQLQKANQSALRIKEHDPLKAVGRGFIYASPDLAVGIIAAVGSLNVWSIVLASVAVAGDFGSQLHNANETERKRVGLVNDIYARRAALGLTYKGHSSAEGAHQINQKYVALQRQAQAVQAQLEMAFGRSLNEVHELATQPKAAKLIQEYNAVKEMVVLEQRKLNGFNSMPDAVKAQEQVRHQIQEQQARLEATKAILRQKQGALATKIPLSRMQQLVYESTQDPAYGTNTSASPHVQPASDEQIIEKFIWLKDIASFILPKPGLFKAEATELLPKLALLDRIAAYFSSLIEMFGAGLSRKATARLYDPLSYYSGQLGISQEVIMHEVQMKEHAKSMEPSTKATKEVIDTLKFSATKGKIEESTTNYQPDTMWQDRVHRPPQQIIDAHDLVNH